MVTAKPMHSIYKMPNLISPPRIIKQDAELSSCVVYLLLCLRCVCRMAHPKKKKKGCNS